MALNILLSKPGYNQPPVTQPWLLKCISLILQYVRDILSAHHRIKFISFTLFLELFEVVFFFVSRCTNSVVLLSQMWFKFPFHSGNEQSNP